MDTVVYWDAEMQTLAPGFSIVEMDFPTTEMSIVRIKMEKKDLPRYPNEGFASLDSDMIVSILSGTIFYCSRSLDRKIPLGAADVVFIPRGEEYYWILETEAVTLLAINNPPFNPANRKV